MTGQLRATTEATVPRPCHCVAPVQPHRESGSEQPSSACRPLLGLWDSDSPALWDLSMVVPAAHTPVPLSGRPLTLLQLIWGSGTPVAPQRSNTVLPKGDVTLSTPGRSSGPWHLLSCSWRKATPARPPGPAHRSPASTKARCGAPPSRKWTRSWSRQSHTQGLSCSPAG